MVASRFAALGTSRWRGPAIAISAASLFLAACSQVGTQSITFWDIVWSMVIFFFWFMLIWIFIASSRTSSGAAT